jgi:CDP-diacylglycerol--glycerol-3-phosphate 3-phosphatidyltransferase
LIYLYASSGATDYVMVAALAMMFSIMTSYARARAESLIDKCKVGFMERPERIVLFMIGAFTNRMAAVLWVILILSIVTVAQPASTTPIWCSTRSRFPADRIRSAGLLARVLLDR